MKVDNWAYGQVKQFATTITGSTPPKKDKNNYGNDLLFVKPPDLQNKIIKSSSDGITLKGAGTIRTAPSGAILVTCIGNLGRVGLTDGEVGFNQQINAIVPSEQLLPKYVFYFAQSPYFRGQLEALASSTTIPIVNKGKFSTIEISFPIKEEQEKIVSKIEELFSEIDSADKGILVSSSLVKTYQQAVIDEIFSAIWPGAKPIQLNDIADIRGGVTKGRKLIDKDVIEIPYLRVANVQDGYLDLRNIKKISGTKDDLIKYGLEYGDILFTEGGDKDKLGRGTIWRSEIEGCIHQNHIFRARVDLSKTDPEFVSFAAQTTRSRHYFFAKAKQTTNLASINMSQLKQLSIPNVDFEEQQNVVRRIKATLSEVAGVRDALKSSANYSELLKQSILSKAFKGELI